jgi:hypothetical protein
MMVIGEYWGDISSTTIGWAEEAMIYDEPILNNYIPYLNWLKMWE